MTTEQMKATLDMAEKHYGSSRSADVCYIIRAKQGTFYVKGDWIQEIFFSRQLLMFTSYRLSRDNGTIFVLSFDHIDYIEIGFYKDIQKYTKACDG